jgi:predicted ABC-type transport system involved in lysophospholipase L1 biosynthesis ATPase subunit
MLQLTDATRMYGSGATAVVALDHVDLAVAHGEQIAVLGPSGAGKTTLLALMGLLDRPTEGSVLLDGSDVGGLSDDARADVRRERIGLVFQLFHLVPALSALENVMLPLVPYRSRRDLDAHARELLGQLGLGDRLRHRPGELSGGEQQRVAIGRALIADPQLVLADEPTGNLDSQTSRQVVDLLATLQAEHGFALVVATHDPTIADRFSRHVLVRDGRLDDGVSDLALRPKAKAAGGSPAMK